MWIGMQSMVSPSSKAAYAIGCKNPSVLTHAPGALHDRAGYSPKTGEFYPVAGPEILIKTTLGALFDGLITEINPHGLHKVINNDFAFLLAGRQLA